MSVHIEGDHLFPEECLLKPDDKNAWVKRVTRELAEESKTLSDLTPQMVRNCHSNLCASCSVARCAHFHLALTGKYSNDQYTRIRMEDRVEFESKLVECLLPAEVRKGLSDNRIANSISIYSSRRTLTINATVGVHKLCFVIFKGEAELVVDDEVRLGQGSLNNVQLILKRWCESTNK